MENSFAALSNAELSNRMNQTIPVVKALFVLPWTKIKIFLFVLHHREPLSTGLLQEFEETGSVCDKRGKGRKGNTSVLRKNFSVQHGRKYREKKN
jgi:hypothetical protein